MNFETIDGLPEEKLMNAEIQRRNIAVERKANDTSAKENYALRKENEELRKLLAYITSFISIEDVGDDVACPGVVISSERFEEHATINGVLGFDKCEHPFNQPLIDVLKRAVRAKESEALEKARERLMKAVHGVMEAYSIPKESGASHE